MNGYYYRVEAHYRDERNEWEDKFETFEEAQDAILDAERSDFARGETEQGGQFFINEYDSTDGIVSTYDKFGWTIF